MEALIKKLEAAKRHKSSLHSYAYPGLGEFNEGLDAAISIIRQHHAEPPEDVVERVARAIRDADAQFAGDMCIGWVESTMLAKAAIAAMPEQPKTAGDAGA